MSRTITHYDEWEEEICDACGHVKQLHHDGSQDSFTVAEQKEN